MQTLPVNAGCISEQVRSLSSKLAECEVDVLTQLTAAEQLGMVEWFPFSSVTAKTFRNSHSLRDQHSEFLQTGDRVRILHTVRTRVLPDPWSRNPDTRDRSVGTSVRTS